MIAFKMCFFSAFNGSLKLSLQFIFYWHLPFEEQCRDSIHPKQNANISQCIHVGNFLLTSVVVGISRDTKHAEELSIF